MDGVFGGYVRHTDDSNPGTYTILMNQDYFGLHANVGVQVNGGAWTEYAMSYAGNDSGNSVWTFTPSQAYAPGAVVQYYFKGYEDGTANTIYDSNGSTNYHFQVATDGSDPLANSWFTKLTGQYARIYSNAAARTAGAAAVTWSNGSQTQALPAYSGVQEVYSSTNWVYVRATGLGAHVMGPWSVGFPNLPVNKKLLYRIPRVPLAAGTKSVNGGGTIGIFVDGVALFNSWDAFYWNGSTEVGGAGTGYWNRDAYVNEGATFDPAYAHQEQTGTYHYHANPIALRYLLGDHVDFNATTKTYSESTNAVVNHSPIIGWVADGYPIYGPYGYSNPTNPASGVRRMIPGYVLRNGQFGTQNLTSTGRTTIPQWAVRLFKVSNAQTGPNVSSSYPLGRYMEDNDYLGDLGYTHGVDFDLDEYNGRYCVTPEFPNGTYAYFTAIATNGAPLFPYNIGRGYYGYPTGGSLLTVAESVTTNFVGGPATVPTMQSIAPSGANDIIITWSSVEGGRYDVQAATNLAAYSSLNTNVPSGGLTSSFIHTNGLAGTSQRFYRTKLAALANYDSAIGSGGILSVVPNTGLRNNPYSITINLDPAVGPPPQMAPVLSVTVGSINGTSLNHVSQTQVTASISIPGGATPGPVAVSVTFPGPPENPSQTVTYTLTNGFTIQ